jgi:hypothetical protein
MQRRHRWVALLVVALCVSLVAPVTGASAHVHKKTRMTAKAKRIERARLARQIKRNPKLITKRSFVKRASLVNFKLPITIRLKNSTVATNPNVANLDSAHRSDSARSAWAAASPGRSFSTTPTTAAPLATSTSH